MPCFVEPSKPPAQPWLGQALYSVTPQVTWEASMGQRPQGTRLAPVNKGRADHCTYNRSQDPGARVSKGTLSLETAPAEVG